MSEKLLNALIGIRAQIDEIIQELGGKSGTPVSSKKPAPIAKQSSDLSFNLNALAFVNKYARGRSGAQKFTLLLAWFTKGSSSVEVTTQEIEKQWNKMRTVLDSEFNPAHANRAKAKGWIDADPAKPGKYLLATSWKDCLKQ
jgi:hypothetical protein